MYDLLIIGSGPAGISAAKYALAANLSTVLIEKSQESFGGVCVNSGCIPTKFFLNSSKLNESWEILSKGKDEIIQKIKTPLLSSLKNRGLKVIWGSVKFLDSNTLNVEGTILKAKNIIIATGSLPKKIINDSKVMFTEELYSKPKLPDKVLVVGGGYVGIETASLLRALGKEVAVVEKEERILPSFDAYLANRLKVILEKKGIKIDIGKNVSECDLNGFDAVISAIGRKPNLSGLGVESIGLELDANGWVKTDAQMRTNVRSIYACGDVTGKKLLAYIAEYQGHICIDNIKGIKTKEDYEGIPECVFSIPQVAKVGKLEEDIEEGIKYEVIKTNFLKFSSSYVYGDIDGFIKILVDKRQRIIGAGIISKSAGELIGILTLCVKSGLKLEDLRRVLLVHPTLSEIIPLSVL